MPSGKPSPHRGQATQRHVLDGQRMWFCNSVLMPRCEEDKPDPMGFGGHDSCQWVVLIPLGVTARSASLMGGTVNAWICYRDHQFQFGGEGDWGDPLMCPLCEHPVAETGCSMGNVHTTVMDFSKAVTVDDESEA